MLNDIPALGTRSGCQTHHMTGSKTASPGNRLARGTTRLFGETGRWWGQVGRPQRIAVGLVAVVVLVAGVWGLPRFVQWKHEQSYLSRVHIRMSDQEKLKVGYQACDWLRAQPASAFDAGNTADLGGVGGIDAAQKLYWRDRDEWWGVNFTAPKAWLQLCRDVAVDKFGSSPKDLFGESPG